MHHSCLGKTSLQAPLYATCDGHCPAWAASGLKWQAWQCLMQAILTQSCGCQAGRQPSGVSLRLETPCKHQPTIMAAGAGQGIGRAFAHALGEAGASVAIVDVNKAKADEVAQELNIKGVRSVSVGADITKKADCER